MLDNQPAFVIHFFVVVVVVVFGGGGGGVRSMFYCTEVTMRTQFTFLL